MATRSESHKAPQTVGKAAAAEPAQAQTMSPEEMAMQVMLAAQQQLMVNAGADPAQIAAAQLQAAAAQQQALTAANAPSKEWMAIKQLMVQQGGQSKPKGAPLHRPKINLGKNPALRPPGWQEKNTEILTGIVSKGKAPPPGMPGMAKGAPFGLPGPPPPLPPPPDPVLAGNADAMSILDKLGDLDSNLNKSFDPAAGQPPAMSPPGAKPLFTPAFSGALRPPAGPVGAVAAAKFFMGKAKAAAPAAKAAGPPKALCPMFEMGGCTKGALCEFSHEME